MTRANRVAVQSTDNGYKADFYRTHKKVATMESWETGWEADESMNKSAQREDFRRFAIEHAEEIGVEWNPADLRTEANKRVPKYENDEILSTDVLALVRPSIETLEAKCPHGVSVREIEIDSIVPVGTSAKGTDLSKLGVINGKYERSGNWAWADISIVVILTKDGQEIYYTTECQLVSGQLKKPHITQTSFNESIKESLKEVGLWVEEVKEDKKPSKKSKEEVQEEPTADTVADTQEVQKEVKEESKPKRTRKSKKSKEEETATE